METLIIANNDFDTALDTLYFITKFNVTDYQIKDVNGPLTFLDKKEIFPYERVIMMNVEIPHDKLKYYDNEKFVIVSRDNLKKDLSRAKFVCSNGSLAKSISEKKNIEQFYDDLLPDESIMKLFFMFISNDIDRVHTFVTDITTANTLNIDSGITHGIREFKHKMSYIIKYESTDSVCIFDCKDNMFVKSLMKLKKKPCGMFVDSQAQKVHVYCQRGSIFEKFFIKEMNAKQYNDCLVFEISEKFLELTKVFNKL